MTIRSRRLIGLVASSLGLLVACDRASEPVVDTIPNDPVVVYFAGEDDAHLRGVLDNYTDVSGIAVTVRRGLPNRIVDDLIADEINPPADVLVAMSVVDVSRAAEEGALRPLFMPAIKERTPAWLRDPDDYWFALSYRSAVVVYATNFADDAELSSYTVLAEPRFRGQLCLSSSRTAVNRSVIAMLIESMGVRRAEIVVRGWMANLARPVVETEDQLVRAIQSGECQAGIASSAAVAKANATGSGKTLSFSTPVPTFADIESVGIARHARNPGAAAALVEWLFQAEVQSNLAMATLSSPAIDSQEVSQQAGARNVGLVAWHEKDAANLAERAGYP
jgi:iron(III) transport system substrate-binding protein